MNKRKRRFLHPFASLAVASGLLVSQAPLTIAHADGYQLLEGKINPFPQHNNSFFASMEQEGIQYLNRIRTENGLSKLSLDKALSYSAQSHSNYLVKYKAVSHLQTMVTDKAAFTGFYPEDRAEYYHYDSDEIGEMISFQTNSPRNAVEKLLDAPYHRATMLNPNFTEVGVGFNDTNDGFNPTVINLGDEDGTQTIEGPVLYPYANQKEVKTSWYANESPNPLRFWNLHKVNVGYPISISFYGENKGKLIARSATLKDENGNNVPFYLVDGEKDGTLSSIFIIPKQALKRGTTYTVDVKAENVSKYSKKTPVSKKWSFTTADGYRLTDLELLSDKNGVKVLKPYFNNGASSTVKYEVQKKGKKVQTFNERGNNGYLGYQNIVDGEYEVIFSFTDSDQIIKQKFLVKGNSLSLINDSLPIEEPKPDKPKTEEPVEKPKPEIPESENPVENSDKENPTFENEFGKESEVTGAPLSVFELMEEREIDEKEESTTFSFPFAIKAESITPQTLFMMDSKGNRQPVTVIVNKNNIEIAFDDMNIKAGQTFELYFDWYFLEGVNSEQLETPQKYVLKVVKGSNEEKEEVEDNKDLSHFIFIKEYQISTSSKGFRIPFSVAIDKNTINEESVFLLNSEGKEVEIDRQLTSNGKALEIRFDKNLKLEDGQTYNFYIDNTIKGVAGNKLPNASMFIIRVVAP